MKTTLIIMAAVYIGSSLFTWLQGLLSATVSQTTVYTLRRDLFKKISYLPIKYTDTHAHGDLMSRMTNDVENISNTISSSVGALISAVLSVLGSIVIMVLYSPLMTLISILTVVLTIIVSTNMSKYMRKFYKEQQTVLGEMNGHVEEMVTGYKTVVAFSKQQKSKNEFNSISSRFRKVAIKAQILSGSMGPLMNIISNLNFILVALSGAYFAFKASPIGGVWAPDGIITVGVIQAFLLYSKQLSRPINEIANQYASIMTAHILCFIHHFVALYRTGSMHTDNTIRRSFQTDVFEVMHLIYNKRGNTQLIKRQNLICRKFFLQFCKFFT